MTTITRFTPVLLTLLTAVAATGTAQRGAGTLPPVPAVHGPLRIVVAYPAAGGVVDFGDSTFIFGTVGDGAATLTVAGQPVAVAPNGAWLAWVSLPHDSIVSIPLRARRGADSATSVLRIARKDWVRESGAWVDRNSLSPVGDAWIPPSESLALAVRAAPGASVRLFLPDGRLVQFAADSIPEATSEAINAFDRSDSRAPRPVRRDRYAGTLGSHADTGRLNARQRESLPPGPVLEVALGRDTTRVHWPITVNRGPDSPYAIALNHDPRHVFHDDPETIGRAVPGGSGTYTWFFPPGTVTRMDMRIGDQIRLRVAADAVAWVPQNDVHEMRLDTDARAAVMGSLTFTPAADRTRLRIPLTRPVPSRVDETEHGVVITLYNAVANANWVRYGGDNSFVQLLTWKQERIDRVELAVTFDRPLWGWRSWIDGTDLVFEFRRPPRIDATRPLAGRKIVVDAGHPPGGACGPTGLCEPEANLNVANIVRDQLRAAGATVIMTRTGPADVNLWPRVALADSVDAELMVSIHNNALPDGLNPFTNNGTSTFYNHPNSLALARAVQARLVVHLGQRDLGVARGDLALVRPTWYPAILTEGLFLMVPEHEAALRSPEGQRRYATAVVEGITAFLREAGQAARARP